MIPMCGLCRRSRAAAAFLLFSHLSLSLAQPVPVDDAEYQKYRKQGYLPISGEQGGRYSRNVYLAFRDVYVNRGDTMTLEPGVMILFKQGTSLNVRGALVCEGNKRNQVTLTSYVEPRDSVPRNVTMARWRGVTVEDSASLVATHAFITNSDFGVKALENYDTVVLDSVSFSNNEFGNLKLGERVILVAQDRPFSYPFAAAEERQPEAKVAEVKEPHGAQWKAPARIVLGVLAAGGAGAAIWAFHQSDVYFDNAGRATTTPDVDSWETKSNRHRLIGGISAGVGGVAAACFVLTFFF